MQDITFSATAQMDGSLLGAYCSASPVLKLCLQIWERSARGQLHILAAISCLRLTVKQSYSALMVMLRLPMSPNRLHWTSCIHLQRPIGLFEPFLQHCPAGHVLSFPSHLDPRRNRGFSSAHHEHLPAALPSHAFELLPTDPNEIYKQQVPQSSIHPYG